jgi:hypothetical protein
MVYLHVMRLALATALSSLCVGFMFSIVASSSHAASSWSCSEPEWREPPEIERGVFTGKLRMECHLSTVKTDRVIPKIRAAIVELLESEREIHGAPTPVLHDAMRGLAYDATTTLKESGGDLKIRESATVVDDGERKLVYRTHSKEISASGMAGYLRAVEFSATAFAEEKQGEGVRIELQNDIQVERPWYALAPIFFVIVKGTAKSKFQTVRERLLQRLSDRIEL